MLIVKGKQAKKFLRVAFIVKLQQENFQTLFNHDSQEPIPRFEEYFVEEIIVVCNDQGVAESNCRTFEIYIYIYI